LIFTVSDGSDAPMDSVVSADDTEIGYRTYGDGRPLVLVHGGSTTKGSWRALRPHLTDQFRVVTYDRRGRGASADADEYDLGREVADLRAVVDAVDGDPVVVGHSYGGLVSLAAAGDLDIDDLVLYEPAVLVGDHRGDDLADRLQARLDDGDREGAIELFFREAGDIHEFDPGLVARATPLAETVVRETRVVEGYELGDPDVPDSTLLLAGEHSPDHLRDAVFELADRVETATVAELSGVGHLGVQTAPEQFAEELRSFLA